jgi:hypothetical protein
LYLTKITNITNIIYKPLIYIALSCSLVSVIQIVYTLFSWFWKLLTITYPSDTRPKRERPFDWTCFQLASASLAPLAIDIDSNLYYSSIIYSLSSALDSLDEGALPQLTRTSINNTTTNNQTFSRDLEGPSSNPLAIGENSFSTGARALPAEPQGKRQRTEQARDLPSLG